MGTSNLRLIVVCLLIASLVSQSFGDIFGHPSRNSNYAGLRNRYRNRNLVNTNHYAKRNLDPYYLAEFKNHLRYLHDNLDNLSLSCCKQYSDNKWIITCDPKINPPAANIQQPSCYVRLILDFFTALGMAISQAEGNKV